MATYALIVVFEGYTGNGGGDGDDLPEDDSNFFTSLGKIRSGGKRSAIDADLLENRIMNAKAAGHDVGTLSAKIINEWYSHGWFELFSLRLDLCRRPLDVESLLMLPLGMGRAPRSIVQFSVELFGNSEGVRPTHPIPKKKTSKLILHMPLWLFPRRNKNRIIC
jgi:hypothetical protein